MAFACIVTGMSGALSRDVLGVGIEAVVFDLDGTLIDSETGWFRTFQAVTAAYERDWTSAEHIKNMSAPRDEWLERVEAKLGLGWSFERYKDMVRKVRNVVDPKHPYLFPGAREAVAWAAERYPVAIASSGSRNGVLRNIERMGIGQYLTVVVGGDEVQNSKPAPDIYLETAARLGVAVEHCLALEDSVNGIRAASSAGARVIAVCNPHFPVPEVEMRSCVAVIDRVGELPMLLSDVS